MQATVYAIAYPEDIVMVLFAQFTLMQPVLGSTVDVQVNVEDVNLVVSEQLTQKRIVTNHESRLRKL